jgi:hypothetical protein
VALTLGLQGIATARADTLTIQGSSTFSTNILTPNQTAIEALRAKR